MASRRDELNAYTFAKRRMVAAFLQPSPTGTDEGAPRPLRAVVPGLVVGALLVAGFGAWGMFKPVAPKDWAAPGAHVIVGKESTARYVVLTTGRGATKRTLLHPVMNLASARLLLRPRQFDVIQVSDDILDSGKLPRGQLLGIPYAPDRLPTGKEAAEAKRWSVCVQPGGGKGAAVQKAAFVFDDRELARTDGEQRLTGGQVLYVRGQDGTRYLVGAGGTTYELSGVPGDHLTRVLVGLGGQPQAVTDDWLATLRTGSSVDFPDVPGTVGTPAGVGGGLTPEQNRVGMVIESPTGSGPQHYVVLPGEVRPVSDFTAWLLINSPETDELDMGGEAATVDAASFTPESGFFGREYRWPAKRATQVNSGGAGESSGRDTVCNVLRNVDDEGRTTLSTWAGADFPAQITAGGTGTYVTPGTGLLYTQIQDGHTRSDGSLFLVTDTGLRYAVQANSASMRPDVRRVPGEAQIRLGYENIDPAPVPVTWSQFLSKGPRLDTDSARRPQGS